MLAAGLYPADGEVVDAEDPEGFEKWLEAHSDEERALAESCRLYTRETLMDELDRKYGELVLEYTRGKLSAARKRADDESRARERARRAAVDRAQVAGSKDAFREELAVVNTAAGEPEDDEDEEQTAEEESNGGTGAGAGTAGGKRRVTFGADTKQEDTEQQSAVDANGKPRDLAAEARRVTAMSDAAAISDSLELAKQRPLVVGMVGYPNVGKSSVINVLLGASTRNHNAKRVAVGATPGKTKHF